MHPNIETLKSLIEQLQSDPLLQSDSLSENPLNSISKLHKYIGDLDKHLGIHKDISLDAYIEILATLEGHLNHVSVEYRRCPEDLFKECYPKIRKEKEGHHADNYHKYKREKSFQLFDECLESCKNGKCPPLDEQMHEFLIDISVEGYILKKAYYDYLKEEKIHGHSEKHYSAAEYRVNVVFRCKDIKKAKDITLSKSLFDFDMADLDRHGEGPRNRKAYWDYLSQKNKNYIADSKDALYMLETLHKCSGSLSDVEKLLTKYPNISNAIDLYRYCICRKTSGSQRCP